MSVAGSEFYALIEGASAILGLQSLFADWGLHITVEVQSDSTSAKSMADRKGVAKVKHMQTRFLWIQERVANGDITIHHVGTKFNPADPFTKPLTKPELDSHMDRIGLIFL